MKNKPEWLDAALAGAPVVLRHGNKAYVRYWEKEYKTPYPLFGCSVNADSSEIYTESWAYDGSYISDQSPNGSDIIGLWQEPAPVFEYWHLINSKYVALAMDEDGCWHAYSSKNIYASERFNEWLIDKGGDRCIGDLFTQDILLTVSDWRQSLILRPEGENK